MFRVLPTLNSTPKSFSNLLFSLISVLKHRPTFLFHKKKRRQRKTCLGVSASCISTLLLILIFFTRFANLPYGLRTELFNPTQGEMLRVLRYSARGLDLCLFSLSNATGVEFFINHFLFSIFLYKLVFNYLFYFNYLRTFRMCI